MKQNTEATSPVHAELEQLAKRGRGVLKPEAIVEFARDETTALHSQFTWDDGKAAHEYRLEQARHLLRVTLIFEPQIDRTMRVFVSLPLDRERKGGGYRRMVDVLSNREHRQQLIASALAELEVFQRKYQGITELAGVFEEVRKFRNSATAKAGRGNRATAKSAARRTA